MPSDIQFEEDGFAKGYPQTRSGQSNYSYGINQSVYSGSEVKGMAGWLIRHHLAKSPQGAQLYLIALVVVNIIITIIALNILL